MYILLYWLLLFFIILYELIRKRESKVDFFTIFNFFFLISYILPCALWVTIPNFAENSPYKLYYNAAETPEVLFSIIIGYFGFFISYTFLSLTRPPFYLSLTLLYSKERTNRKITSLMLLFCLFVIFGIILIGGIPNFIAAGIEARHNHSNFGIVGYFRYLYSAFPAIFFCIAMLVLSNQKTTIKTYILFSCISAIGIIALLSSGGRGAIITVFINLFFFLYMVDKIKIKLSTTTLSISVCFLLLFVVLELHSISNSIITGSEVNITSRFKEFPSKIMDSILAVFQYYIHYLYLIYELINNPKLYNYPRIGSDNISAFILLLPGFDGTSLGFYELPDNLSQGVMGKTNGLIPPGWLGWTLLNGGFFWLFIKTLYSAFFAIIIDKSKKHIIRQAGYYLGSYIYFLLIIFTYSILFNGTAANLLRGNLGIILFFFLLCIIPITRIIKPKIIKTL